MSSWVNTPEMSDHSWLRHNNNNDNKNVGRCPTSWPPCQM